MIKKCLITFVFALIFLFSKSNTVIAQTQNQTKNNCPVWGYTPFCAEINDEPHLLNMSLASAGATTVWAIFGTVGQPIPITNKQGQVMDYRFEGGAAGNVGTLAMQMIQKPGGTSTTEYLADIGRSLNIIKPSYAQGASFAGLSPILTIWKLMTNVAYLIYVLVFFVVGFMILLRKKIDPRTIISIESALPRLIVSLILITFSYAIIAFLIDAANLISQVIANIFIGPNNILCTGTSAAGKPCNADNYLREIFGRNIFHLVRQIGDTTRIQAEIGQGFAGGSAPAWYKDPGGAIVGGAVNWIGSNATWLVFAMSTLFISFKIFFALLTPYVQIVVAIIFAPFELLLIAIPGSEKSVGGWLKGLLAKIAVFPTTFLMIILAASFGANANHSICKNAGSAYCFDWLPANSDFLTNQVGNLNFVLTPFGNWGGAVGALISFGILLTIPNVVEVVQNAFKVKDQGGAIGASKILQSASKLPLLGSIVKN